MARGINKVFLLGNLGQDPQLRYTGSGTAVCNMRLATDDVYRNAKDDLVEKTEWHNVVAWGRLAEICAEYLEKGSQVHFEGSLETRRWKDGDGNVRYTTQIRIRELIMLDGAAAPAAGDAPAQRARAQQPINDEALESEVPPF